MRETKIASREQRLRRTAKRRGLLLVKCRRRDPFALGFGLYVLVTDTRGNRSPDAREPKALFGKGYGGTLADIEAELESVSQ
jgi:hypothetical protein